MQACLRYFVPQATPQPTPAPVSTPNTANQEISDLREDVKAIKALIASIAPTQAPAKKQAKPSFAEAASAAPRPAQPRAPRNTPTQPSTHPLQPSHQPPARPRLVVQVSRLAPSPSPNVNKLLTHQLVGALTASLRTSAQHSQVNVSAIKWTASGNLVVTAGPDTTAEQLLAASPTITSALKPLLQQIFGQSVNLSATLDVKWAKITLHGIPTGVSHTRQAFDPAECDTDLRSNNPVYRGLKITQRPSWVRNPTSYTPDSSSSLVFAFEDPDGTLARKVIATPFYAFGTATQAKRWKAKPANSKTPPPSTNAPPAPPAQDILMQGIQTLAPVRPSSPPSPSPQSRSSPFTASAGTNRKKERRAPPVFSSSS